MSWLLREPSERESERERERERENRKEALPFDRLSGVWGYNPV
jgi:hypothetical protein